ncbi:hypothetical protein REPUB_Repub02eG0001600 [Reevesia pubescens]
MYVRDVEMNRRYLEGECRRRGRMLHCFIVQNQALRLTFHNKGSPGADLMLPRLSRSLLCSCWNPCRWVPCWLPGHHVPVHPANTLFWRQFHWKVNEEESLERS